MLLLLFLLPWIGAQIGWDLNILGWLVGVPTEGADPAGLAGHRPRPMNEPAPAPGFAAATPDRDRDEPEALVLDLDGYEGPIDLLLSLARAQKLDLAKISIRALADQYLDFIAARRRLDLEIAADYLVMAAILAYLKSCLLLPPAPRDDEPSPQELALGLRHRLALLEAMQRAGRRLMARPLLGREVFARGAPEELAIVTVPRWQIGLYELLRAYGDVHRRQGARVLPVEPSAFQSVQEALRDWRACWAAR